jgi:short-subunit dehydrogenase
MNVVFLGATRGIGRALARQMAGRGDRLVLLGRDPAELARCAADLRARAGREEAVAGTAVCDLLDTSGFAPALAAARAALERVDCVVVTAGMFARADALEADLALAERLLHANFTATVIFCERARLLLGPGGTLCVFSSVAGERGRKPIALYGASKAGLSAYLEALDHRLAAEGLRVVTVKPGFVRTAMTAGLPEPPFAGDAEPVAARALAAIDRGSPVVYAPAIWRWVMAVIRLLPRAVMRRVGF